LKWRNQILKNNGVFMMKILTYPLLIIVLAATSACSNMSGQQQGTLSGAGIGALAGAGIAAISGGSGWTGAAVGAVAGGVIGNIKGAKDDKARKR
jgi:outer membrane lipoprotein SlyB